MFLSRRFVTPLGGHCASRVLINIAARGANWKMVLHTSKSPSKFPTQGHFLVKWPTRSDESARHGEDSALFVRNASCKCCQKFPALRGLDETVLLSHLLNAPTGASSLRSSELGTSRPSDPLCENLNQATHITSEISSLCFHSRCVRLQLVARATAAATKLLRRVVPSGFASRFGARHADYRDVVSERISVVYGFLRPLLSLPFVLDGPALPKRGDCLRWRW